MTLGVADLSLKGGAESTKHRSHLSGRDADLHFKSSSPSLEHGGLGIWPREHYERPDALSAQILKSVEYQLDIELAPPGEDQDPLLDR